MEKEREEERERFRDLEERLLRTEQFADQTLFAQNRLEAETTRLQDDLAVSHQLGCACCLYLAFSEPLLMCVKL